MFDFAISMNVKALAVSQGSKNFTSDSRPICYTYWYNP